MHNSPQTAHMKAHDPLCKQITKSEPRRQDIGPLCLRASRVFSGSTVDVRHPQTPETLHPACTRAKESHPGTWSPVRNSRCAQAFLERALTPPTPPQQHQISQNRSRAAACSQREPSQRRAAVQRAHSMSFPDPVPPAAQRTAGFCPPPPSPQRTPISPNWGHHSTSIGLSVAPHEVGVWLAPLYTFEGRPSAQGLHMHWE